MNLTVNQRNSELIKVENFTINLSKNGKTTIIIPGTQNIMNVSQ